MAEVSLEIPSAPLAALAALPRASRTLRAKVLRTEHAEAYNLVGLKFSRPLVNDQGQSDRVTKEARFFRVKNFSLIPVIPCRGKLAPSITRRIPTESLVSCFSSTS